MAMSDTDKATAHLRAADPVLARIIDKVGPPAIHRHDDHFHALVSSIVSQQVSTHAARAIMARVQSLLDTHGGLTPTAFLGVDPEALRGAGLSRMKALYILDLAARTADGSLDLHSIVDLDDEDVITALTAIKGIGRWTAQMFLIFSLGRPDVLPVDDLGFRGAVRQNYGLDALPTAGELHTLAATWSPYRSFATWYLWRSLNNVPRTET